MTLAEVKLWGRTIGAVSLEDGGRLAALDARSNAQLPHGAAQGIGAGGGDCPHARIAGTGGGTAPKGKGLKAVSYLLMRMESSTSAANGMDK